MNEKYHTVITKANKNKTKLQFRNRNYKLTAEC